MEWVANIESAMFTAVLCLEPSKYMIASNMTWKRLLIVDDDITTRQLIRRMVTDIGFSKIEEAVDGSQAIKRTVETEPDLVLCDIQMEPLEGLSFLKAVRTGNSDMPRDLRVIMVTGLSGNSEYGTALALDADGFLPKPVHKHTLEKRLVRCFAENRSVRDVEAYRVIPIPGRDQMASDSVTADGSSANLGGTKKNISALEEGEVLVRDLRLSDGSLLLAAGMKISKSLLSRIKDLAEMDEIKHVYVE